MPSRQPSHQQPSRAACRPGLSRTAIGLTVLALGVAGCSAPGPDASGSTASPPPGPGTEPATATALPTGPALRSAAPAATQPPPSPAVPTAGPVDATLPETGTGAIDVERYDLALDYGMGTTGVLTGTATLHLTARTALTAIPLDLRGIPVTAVTVDGRPATARFQGSRLSVTPASPLAAGARATVVVRYQGPPPQYRDQSGAQCGFVVRAGGVAAVNEPNCASGWFPANDAPWDKARFVITTSVPEGWTVAGNGRLVARTTQGGKSTFTWDSVDPMAPYLATASIGRFELRTSRSPSGVEIVDAVDPALPASAAAPLARTGEMLGFLEERFGPYPLVSAGSILSPADLPYELETQTRVYLGAGTDESTLLHELTHQWWGNSVTPRSWSDLWINEGACTYAEWEWGEAQGGPSVDAQAAAVMARPAGDPFWRTTLTSPGPAGLFSKPLYQRSAAFFALLRRELGNEGFATLRTHWLSEHKDGTGSTEQLQALASDIAGEDLGPLFDAWVRSGTRPR